MVDINVEKKNTSARIISSLKNVKSKAKSIRESISIDLRNKSPKNTSDWTNMMTPITPENPRNFQRINSHLLIGFESIKKIVFPSISLKRS